MAKKPDDNRYYDVTKEFAHELMVQTAAAFFERLEELPSDQGTPIERLVGAGLAFALRSYEWFGGEGWGEGDGWPFLNVPPNEARTVTPASEGVMIWFQAPVGRYTADFLICMAHFGGGYVWGAIECDGHDHHNLTKEQAKHDRERDRFFQKDGVIILRYTGSEIWKSPLKCAVDALTILQDRAKAPEAKRWMEV